MAPGTAVGRRIWRPDAVIALSAHVARTIATHLRVPVDVCGGLLARSTGDDVALPAELPSTPFALFAGDPGRHKGFDVLLAAWADDLLAGVPLVVASTKKIDRALPPSITVVHLDRTQMPSAWRRAAVAVVPSIWDEPFGMVAMESLAAGTPVVASDVGALGEVVRDGVDGVLVAPGDARALAAAVLELMRDDALRSRLGTAAREGSARFAADVVAGRVDDVYARVLATTAASA